jgi:tripartite-type tricarboxylate transporter receptor subunit TctC
MKTGKWISASLWLGLMAGSGAAGAQGYPTHPIRMVVPFSAGGGSDVIGRIVGQKLSEVLGQQIVVDNRVGAGGNIGADIVAKAAPDGYTLLMTNIALGINAGLPGKLPFDTLKDFVPVALVATSAMVVAVHPSVKVSSITELVALAKAKPGSLSYSSCGNGTLQHLGGEMLKQVAHIDMAHIPYRGCSQAVAGTLGGDVPVTFNSISTVLPFVKSGQLRMLAIGAAQRSKTYPDVPTIAEAGFADYDADLWMGILAPAGTPKDVVDKLNQAINRVVATPEVQQSYRAQFVEPRSGTPEQFAALLRREVAKWSALIRDANIQAD